jgi:PAS domain S-box-containing protein
MIFTQAGKSLSIPRGLIWFTVGICILPFLLNLTGVDFGIEDFGQKSGLQIMQARFMHIALDAFAVAIAFLTAILGFIHFSIKRDIVAPIVGVALFCAALPDAIHLIGSTSGPSQEDAVPTRLVAYTWLFSRSFHVIVLIMGALIFLLRSRFQKEHDDEREKKFVYKISLFFLALTAGSIFLLMFTDNIPQVIFPERAIPRPYDFVILLAYIIAGVTVLPFFYSRFPSVFSQTLMLSMVPALATEIHMALGSRAMLDNDFFIAHILKCVTYFIPFVGMGLSYYRSQQNEIVTLARLQEEQKEKIQAAETLKGVLHSSLSGIQAFSSIRNKEGRIIDFRCLLMNPSAEVIEGKKASEVVGRTMLEVYPWTKERGYFQKYVELVEKGKSINYEYFSAQHKKWLHTMAVKVKDGFAVTYTDITPRKNTEQALVQGKKKFETVFNQTFQFIHVLTPEGIVVDVNGTALEFSGSRPADVMGRYFWDLPEWDMPGAVNKLSAAVRHAAEGAVERYEAEVKSKAGKIITIDFSIKPVKGDSGEIIMLVAEGRDISQQKEAARQIARYQEELEMRIEELNRSNKELEQFAYVASHDLQEPLRKVRAFGDRLVIKYKDALGEEGKGYIERMENAAERMQVLINELLNFSRISRTTESYIEVDLEKVVRSVINDLEISIEQKKASIDIGHLPVIYAIPSQMRQLFQNLLSNALKFSSPDRDPRIFIEASIVHEEGEEMCRIKVADNGIGFDEKYADRIFNIFQRLHGRNEYEGTGIGLAIVKKIAENHRGSITARSTPGEGSVFTIVLPVKH